MISLDEYLQNPCGKLSIPHWKNKSICTPAHIKIVHEKDYPQVDNALLQTAYSDTAYFRLSHTLDNVQPINLVGFDIKTPNNDDIESIVNVINQSYTDLSVTYEQILGYTKTSVYDSNLWILVYDSKTKLVVGCGIADFDSEVKEGIIEWIQVLPEYRGNGIGRLIVNELLYRMVNKATFATVSGKVNSESNPEVLYRKCGFIGNDIWHILSAK